MEGGLAERKKNMEEITERADKLLTWIGLLVVNRELKSLQLLEMEVYALTRHLSRSFWRYHHRSSLGVLSSSRREFQSPAPQITIFPKGSPNVVCPLH